MEEKKTKKEIIRLRDKGKEKKEKVNIMDFYKDILTRVRFQ